MAHSHAEPPVFTGYGADTDAELVCSIPAFREGTPERGVACALDPKAELEKFRRSMDTQFAINATCHGIEFFDWRSKKSHEYVTRPYWHFFLYPPYGPGDEQQGWILLSPDRANTFSGEGRPKEIVQDVCAAITGKGGVILR